MKTEKCLIKKNSKNICSNKCESINDVVRANTAKNFFKQKKKY